jgi:nucleoside-diphosphate-sugar epimerase
MLHSILFDQHAALLFSQRTKSFHGFSLAVPMSTSSNKKAVPTVLVFGASGKIGRALVDKLHQTKQVHVIASVRSVEKAAPFQAAGIETRILDLNAPERHGLETTLIPALRGVDRIFYSRATMYPCWRTPRP